MGSRSAGGGFHGLGLFQPGGQRRVRQQARAKRTGIHHAHAFGLEIRHGFIGKARVLQRVLVVAQHAVDRGLIDDELENLHRVAAETDVARLAGFLDFSESGQRLVHDLLHRHEFDVVAQNDIEVIRAEPVQRNIDALRDALRGKIEVREIVAAEFGAEGVAFARHAFQCDTEQDLAHPPAVERRGVDEVEAAVERDAHAPQGLVQRNTAKLSPKGAGAKTEHREVKIGLTETASLHGNEQLLMTFKGRPRACARLRRYDNPS